MLSNGGVIGIDVARRFPVRMVESGPAAGALAAAYYAEVLGLDRLLSFDMGGTTAKACIIEDRSPLVVGNFEVDRIYRFKSGSGLPILIPSVDMIEIGAGGGSIASVSDLGLLKVGPQSAGSMPGPACYGRGGKKPTVTDADLVLGYLSADNFLGGDMKLDLAGAQKAARRTGEGARHLDGRGRRRHLSRRRRVHDGGRARACDRSRHRLSRPAAVRLRRRRAGACLLRGGTAGKPGRDLSAARERALGLRHAGDAAAARSRARRAVAAVGARLGAGRRAALPSWSTDARGGLASAGCKPAEITLRFGADMRYFGQQNEVTTWFDTDPREKHDLAWVRETFEKDYEKLYHLRLPDVEVEVVSWRLIAHRPARRRATARPSSSAAPAKAEEHAQGALRWRATSTRRSISAASSRAIRASAARRSSRNARPPSSFCPAGARRCDATGCIMAAKE